MMVDLAVVRASIAIMQFVWVCEARQQQAQWVRPKI